MQFCNFHLTGAMPCEPDHERPVVPEVGGPEVLGVGEQRHEVGLDSLVRLAGVVGLSGAEVADGLQEAFSPDVAAVHGLLAEVRVMLGTSLSNDFEKRVCLTAKLFGARR